MLYYPSVARTPKPYRLASRISTDCRRMLDAIMAKTGVNESSAVELSVREYAAKIGIDTAPPVVAPRLPGGGQVMHERPAGYVSDGTDGVEPSGGR